MSVVQRTESGAKPVYPWRSPRFAGIAVFKHGKDTSGNDLVVVQLEAGTPGTALALLKSNLAGGTPGLKVALLLDLLHVNDDDQEEFLALVPEVLTSNVGNIYVFGARAGLELSSEIWKREPAAQKLELANLSTVLDIATLNATPKREVTFSSPAHNSSLTSLHLPVPKQPIQELAIITPNKELLFPRPRGATDSECALTIANNVETYIAFKIKTTAAEKYKVRPNVGLLKPAESMQVAIFRKAIRPVEPEARDRFLVMLTAVPAEVLASAQQDLVSFWRTVKQSAVVEHKLQCYLASTAPRSREELPHMASAAVVAEVRKVQASITELQLQVKHLSQAIAEKPAPRIKQPAPPTQQGWVLGAVLVLVGILVGVALALLLSNNSSVLQQLSSFAGQATQAVQGAVEQAVESVTSMLQSSKNLVQGQTASDPPQHEL